MIGLLAIAGAGLSPINYIYQGDKKDMNSNNDIWLALNEVLNKAENEFSLSEVFQKNGISKDEPVTVEFACGDELLCSQTRFFDSSNACCKWGEVMEQGMKNPERRQISENIGQEVAEAVSKAGMLPSLKNVLLKRGVGISEKNPVTVNFRLDNVGVFSLRCPCGAQACCHV